MLASSFHFSLCSKWCEYANFCREPKVITLSIIMMYLNSWILFLCSACMRIICKYLKVVFGTWRRTGRPGWFYLETWREGIRSDGGYKKDGLLQGKTEQVVSLIRTFANQRQTEKMEFGKLAFISNVTDCWTWVSLCWMFSLRFSRYQELTHCLHTVCEVSFHDFPDFCYQR